MSDNREPDIIQKENCRVAADMVVDALITAGIIKDEDGNRASEIAAEEIYIQLLGDEEGTLRPTQAASLGNNLYRVLPIPNYETADEEWEFVPGTIVRCESRLYREQEYLLAVERVEYP